MSDAGNTGRTDPNAQPPGNEGAGKRKIAGKFDTLEEAVEKGYVGLETGFQDLSGKVNKLTQLLEDALTGGNDQGSQGTVRVGQSGPASPTYDPYGRGSQQQVEDEFTQINPADFIANPAPHLRRIAINAENRATQRNADFTAQYVNNALTVSEWKTRNSDLNNPAAERLVASFMRELDPRQPLTKRLDEAGRMAREHIAEIRGARNNRGNPPPNNDSYTEGPGNSGSGGAGDRQEQQLKAEESEEDLMASIQEFNKTRSSKFDYKRE